MAQTLTTLRDEVETHLSDASNLVYSQSMLDQAIRAALRDLSKIYGDTLTLNGLDGKTDTTFDAVDDQTMITGSVAHALRLRVMSRIEEASPENFDQAAFASLAQKYWLSYEADLTLVKLRRFQASTNKPYSVWEF